MVRSSFEAEPVTRLRADLGEGPVWDARTGSLLWVDIPQGHLHRTEPDGTTHTMAFEPPISAVFPTESAGVLVAARAALLEVTDDTAPRLVAEVIDQPGIRCNDGICDSAGRVWIGTMSLDRRPDAHLYRVGLNGHATPVVDGVTVSNGLGFSPDDRLLYYIDSPTYGVDVFDYDPTVGEISARRRFATIDEADGRPDGLTVDAEGGVWVALVTGGRLHRYAPDGHLDQVVPLPVRYPTSCAFGGPDLDQLFVTSAASRLTPAEREQYPLEGRLLRLEPGIRGLPTRSARIRREG